MDDITIVHSRPTNVDGFMKFNDLRVINSFNKAEFQIAKSSDLTNCDFEIQINMGDWTEYDIQIGDWIYIPETEWGGRVEIINHNDDDVVKVSGPNLAVAILQRSVVCPPYDSALQCRSDYLYINNLDANKMIQAMIDSSIVQDITKRYIVSSEPTLVNITCQCRYEYLLSKLISVLDENDMRLKVTHTYDYDAPFLIQAVKKNHLDEIYNQDFNMTITSQINTVNKYDLLIGLGKGDLQERQVIILKVETDIFGKRVFTEIGLNDVINTDSHIKQYIYDYSSAESMDDLKNSLIEKYIEELSGTSEVSLEIGDDADLQLGDVVGVSDTVTGLSTDAEVTKKIFSIQGNKIKFTYKVGEN